MLDLSLSHEDKSALDKQLQTDEDARLMFESYRRLQQLLEEQEQMSVPANFTELVMAKLPEGHTFAKSESAMPDLKVRELPWKRMVVGFSLVAACGLFYTASRSGLDSQGSERPTGEVQEFVVVSPVNEQSSGVTPKITPSNPVASHSLKLIVHEGVVRVKRSERQVEVIRRGEDATVAYLDEIETGLRSQAEIVWPDDGVKLKLKPRTRLQVASNSIRLHHGDTWVNVLRKGTHFEVQTPNLVAAVRGTIFSTNVRYSTASLQSSLHQRAFSFGTDSDALSASGGSLARTLEFLSGARDLPFHDPMLRTSEVNVFEGAVEVSDLRSQRNSEVLFAGEAIGSEGTILAQKDSIEAPTWLRWQKDLEAAGVALTAEAVDASTSGRYANQELELRHEIKPDDSFERDLQE